MRMGIVESGRDRRRRLAVIGLLALLLALQGLFGAGRALAHAELVQSSPAANEELTLPPQQITLTFSERLEDGVNTLRVYDRSKRQLDTGAAELNAGRTALTLKLPRLDQGTYLVTYHIISADGHPVSGTYLFAVGESLSVPADGSDPLAGAGHLHAGGGPFQRIGIADVLQYASRMAFYLAMLALTGWLLWLRWFGAGSPEGVRTTLARWGDRLQQTYLIVYILFMWAHMTTLIGDGGAEALIRLFTRTSVGYAWLAGLLLALASFALTRRRAWLDYAFVAAVWLSKSFLGHAAAFEPRTETIMLSWLHLFAASVWIGGLLMLGLLWRKEREEAGRLYKSFSLAALLSLLLLIVSGVFSTLLFLPDVRYVLETVWGRLLLAKSALVLLVVCTALVLRRMVARRRMAAAGTLLRLDMAWMLLITGIVGVFTYMNPLPGNTPLQWHVMGDKIHMTAQISPNAPGVNDFTVKVWLPEPLGKPKQVLAKLQLKDSDIAPIEVPVAPFEDTSQDESYGMKKYSFKAKGPYLPYPGVWNLEIRVMDSEDNETVYKKEMKIF